MGKSKVSWYAYALSIIAVFNILWILLGGLPATDSGKAALVLADVVLVILALTPVFLHGGKDEYLIVTGMVMSAVACAAVTIAFAIVASLVRLPIVGIICVYLVITAIWVVLAARASSTSQHIERTQTREAGDRQFAQFLPARVEVLLASEHDLERRRVLERARTSLMGLTTERRGDLAVQDRAIEADVTLLEDLCAAHAATGELASAVDQLARHVATREQSLKLRL